MKGNPIAVMLLALTIVRMPARCAAKSAWNDTETLFWNVVTSGIRPFTGIAARWTSGVESAVTRGHPRKASSVWP